MDGQCGYKTYMMVVSIKLVTSFQYTFSLLNLSVSNPRSLESAAENITFLLEQAIFCKLYFYFIKVLCRCQRKCLVPIKFQNTGSQGALETEDTHSNVRQLEFHRIQSDRSPLLPTLCTMSVGILALQGSFNKHLAGIFLLLPKQELFPLSLSRLFSDLSSLYGRVLFLVFVALRRLGMKGMEIRKAEQLEHVTALIIPGGESTTMAKLAEYHNLVSLIS